MAQRFHDCEKEKTKIQKDLKSEKSTVDLLRRDYAYLENEKTVLESGMQDYKRTLHELQKLKNVETVFLEV